MSKEYLPDREKRILLSAISREKRIIRENNLSELIPIIENLDYKFMYDRLFKQIENKAYQQGRADEREYILNWLEARYIACTNNGDYYSISKIREQLKENDNESK